MRPFGHFGGFVAVKVIYRPNKPPVRRILMYEEYVCCLCKRAHYGESAMSFEKSLNTNVILS